MARRRSEVGHDGVVNEVPRSGRRLGCGAWSPSAAATARIRRRRSSDLAGRGSGHQIRHPEGLIWCSLARICAGRPWMCLSRAGGLAGHRTRAEGRRSEQWGRQRCGGGWDGALQHSGALLSPSFGGGATARRYGRGGGGWRRCWLRRRGKELGC
jgi:hypothetical protein